MSKWHVERHATLRGRGTSEPAVEYTWCAFHNESDIEETHKHFVTWREAIDYADRKARTIESVIPRVTYGDKVVAGKGIYSLHVEHLPNVTEIRLGGFEGVTVENHHLEDLVQHLAGCAAKWEANQ